MRDGLPFRDLDRLQKWANRNGERRNEEEMGLLKFTEIRYLGCTDLTSRVSRTEKRTWELSTAE